MGVCYTTWKFACLSRFRVSAGPLVTLGFNEKAIFREVHRKAP